MDTPCWRKARPQPHEGVQGQTALRKQGPGTSWWSVARTRALLLWTRVPSLVWELRSHKLREHGTSKNEGTEPHPSGLKLLDSRTRRVAQCAVPTKLFI